jgi:hypothetical protein
MTRIPAGRLPDLGISEGLWTVMPIMPMHFARILPDRHGRLPPFRFPAVPPA